MFSSQSEAKNLINEIITKFNTNKPNEINQSCNLLIKHLFSHQYLLFTNFNYFFESNNLLSILISTLDIIQEHLKRDVLRLIYLLLQVNKSLRNEARKSNSFQTILLKYLEQYECWENRVRFKHLINIASQLLVDKDSDTLSFNILPVRKLVRKTIDDLISMNNIQNDDVLPCIIFYACCMCTTKFENIPRIPEDSIVSENIFVKDFTGKILDLIRDYIQDFKKFYELEEEQERKHFVLYKPKSEYSFQQLCNLIIYYLVQNKNIRMNIYQSGLYSLINNFLSIKNVPEQLLLYGFDILKIPPLDITVFTGVKNELLQPLGDKLKVILNNNDISQETKQSVEDLLNLYDIPYERSINCAGNLTQNLLRTGISLSFNNSQKTNNHVDLPDSLHYENWDLIQVQEWFDKNNLKEVKNVFTHLSGHGLQQLWILSKRCEKMNFVIFLMEKVKLPFDITLELISALEKL